MKKNFKNRSVSRMLFIKKNKNAISFTCFFGNLVVTITRSHRVSPGSNSFKEHLKIPAEEFLFYFLS